MFSRKWFAAVAVGALVVAGQALAADKKVVAVS
ncbi:ABC transporter substrate-binding protein, partial [Mesorhizobium sp. M2A.F.Ca.ET.046.02.1.1]